MKNVAILGSTGSIGKNACELLSSYPDEFRVSGIAAGSNIDLLIRQVERFQPGTIAVKSRENAERLLRLFPDRRIGFGSQGLIEVVSQPRPDIVIAAINGTDALEAVLHAAQMKVRICLANKESLVVAGDLLQGLCAKHGAEIIPIDSEQSAIFQCLGDHPLSEVKRIILTASGGPFLKRKKSEFAALTAEEALVHPIWSMGRKITIDSASLMNKALEIIETHHLFHVESKKIEVLIHPQSIVHSMVEFVDSVVLAQMSVPDMRVPILYSLSYPRRMASTLPPVELARLRSLEFYDVDRDKFPSITMAFEVLRQGKSAGAVFDTANEVAVELFLKKQINFSQIFILVGKVLERSVFHPLHNLEDILATIQDTKKLAFALAKGEL